jgi:hypothetical protein
MRNETLAGRMKREKIAQLYIQYWLLPVENSKEIFV